MADRPVTLAAIAGAHGVTGEVRLKLFADSVDSLKAHKTFNGGALTLKSLRDGPNGPVARFAEIADRNAADALRGTVLSVPRQALPPLADGEYYYADLLGLPCVTAGGVVLGHVVAVENFGAGDVIEIENADGGRWLAPFRAGVADLIEGQVFIDAAFVA